MILLGIRLSPREAGPLLGERELEQWLLSYGILWQMLKWLFQKFVIDVASSKTERNNDPLQTQSETPLPCELVTKK